MSVSDKAVELASQKIYELSGYGYDYIAREALEAALPALSPASTGTVGREELARAIAKADKPKVCPWEDMADNWRLVYQAQADAVLTLLQSAPVQEWRGPEGWKLVPVEPTEEMLEGALEESGNRVTAYMAPRESGVATECDLSEEDAECINRDLKTAYGEMYKAMLAAAPVSAPITED